MLDGWGPYVGQETGRGKLGKLANRATGWKNLAPGSRVAYQTDVCGSAAHELTIRRVFAHDGAEGPALGGGPAHARGLAGCEGAPPAA
eukprot:2205726-Alexandrium_andersonii.AAC.1